MTKKPTKSTGTPETEAKPDKTPEEQRRFGLRADDSFLYRFREPFAKAAEEKAPRIQEPVLFRDESGFVYVVMVSPDTGGVEAVKLAPTAFATFIAGATVQSNPKTIEALYSSIAIIRDDLAQNLCLLLRREHRCYPDTFLKRSIDLFREGLKRLGEDIRAADDPKSLQSEAQNLWAAFARSALGEQKDQSSGDDDPVAQEIAAEVTMRWADRKKPEYKGLPWIKNCRTFIWHVYRKWLEAGVLRLSHLRWDKHLYDAYAGYMRDCRKNGWEPDLILPAEPRTSMSNPVEALKRKRQKAAEAQRRYQNKKSSDVS